ncbi:MAG: hypothetical protein A3E23_14685 [Burkholderiales bacterium RIFCSPHIGHO2_12_FULL_65_48]|nr:MAG: hypothetical protein A3C40_22630 [Burkholderiales bacterium RIFCSPHIGHO2_02_FULL_64_19]OGB26337.1 MAG: hypothetical protein A3E23_14685 [Burkholderiales bacterium RIFCSPHIGHO2_12_FULL_65_48]OGB54612.1 MAG: hypothetical protein A3F71_14295 [Burkholderiales bacterium RIFCSPLOWO2_12_FULL_64_33]
MMAKTAAQAPTPHPPTAPGAATRTLHGLARTWLLGAALVLSACGGGGGGGGDEAPPAGTTTFRVGGQLAGLGVGKTVVIADASGPSAAVSANGSYSLQLPAGTTYSLRIAAQPVGQTCTLTNATGTVTADVNNISVACLDNAVPSNARTLGGSVAGLGTSKTLVLQLSAGGATQEASVAADGLFEFAQPVAGPYRITVRSQPLNQTCTVSGGEGVADSNGPAPSISVACAATAFRLSGTVSGNIGVVALRNTANGDTVTVGGNGAFSFAQPVLAGTAYSVTVFDLSAGQTCSVGGGTGFAMADVTQITVGCEVDASPPPPTPVAVPAIPTLTLAYDVKTFKLSWGAIAPPAGGGAVTYRVTEDPDGAGPAAATQIATGLTGTSYERVVAGLLHTRLNATYRVQACNTAGCSALSPGLTVDLTKAIGYFKASNTGANDQFGTSVALSGDGNTLAVGANREASNATGIGGNQADNSAGGAGAVYVFTRSGSTWSQQAYVKASNTEANDHFGYSVALSGDGNTLAVGVRYESSNATGIDGNQADNSAGGAGAVYVFTRSGSTWSQQAYVKASNTEIGDQFGFSVALSGDGNTLAVGAYTEDSNATGINGNQADNSASSSGAVYVFTRSGSTWGQQVYVKASNTDANDAFGYSVALSGDGNTLAVGAYGEASYVGAVYVFIRSGSTWAQQAYVKASSSEASDWFGTSVALSGDGNTLAVGAFGEDSNATGVNGTQADNSASNAGAVYVFTRTGSAWSQQAYVKASNTEADDTFGMSVAMSGDGNTLAVGARQEHSNATGIGGNQADNSALYSGAVYVFTRSGSTWTQQAYVKASNSGLNDRFGTSVALSGDGNTMAVGAYREGSNATGINGDQTNNSAGASGAVYVY